MVSIFELGSKQRSDHRTEKYALRLKEYEGVTEAQIHAIAANAEFVEQRVAPFCQALNVHDTETAMNIFNSSPYPHQVVITLWLAGSIEIAPVRPSFIKKHDQA